jgi:methionyl-tRNA formyltransferase
MRLRIVFMGTPEFAVPSLDALLRSDDEVVGVVTQPDRPKGRTQTLTPPPVKLLALQQGLSVLQPEKMKDPAFLEALRAWQPDLIAVTAFGRILPKVILDMPPRGCVNVHGSLLPKYRGAAPIQWAVINGESETGITTMLMDEGMDTGPMLLQARIPIAPTDTGGTLAQKLAPISGALLVDTIRQLKMGTLVARPQDHALATLAPILKKEDGLIDWRLQAKVIANRVRGLSPWPGAFTYAGADRWLLWAVTLTSLPSGGAVPGSICATRPDALLVATGDDLLAITEFQPASSRRMTVPQYLAGHPPPIGLRLTAQTESTRPA